jgi:hypothetical protein
VGRKVSQMETNKYLNTENFLWLVLGTGLVIEGISLKNGRWGGSISRNISAALKKAGPIGIAAFGFLVGHWIDDAEEEK